MIEIYYLIEQRIGDTWKVREDYKEFFYTLEAAEIEFNRLARKSTKKDFRISQRQYINDGDFTELLH
jgi:hypothetical protein